MTLYLHIGRGKSGSSTIQSLATTHVDYMERAGFSCPLSVKGLPNHGRLAAALNAIDSDRATIRKFRKDLAQAASRNVFVSAEALHSLKRDGIARLRRFTRDRDVQILFYVRDYPSWIPSMYAQPTKHGRNLQDIDSFVRGGRRNLSVVARLDRWAEAFGWEAMRIRPLDASILVGGTLIADLLHALGVAEPPPEVARENESPHWMTLEIVRALAIAATTSAIGSVGPRSLKGIVRLCEACMDPATPRRTPYLTRAQWLDAAELYRRDMEALGQRVGMMFPVALPEPLEREFLPDFEAVPRDVCATILDRLDDPRFSSPIDPAASILLRDLLSTKSPRQAPTRKRGLFALGLSMLSRAGVARKRTF